MSKLSKDQKRKKKLIKRIKKKEAWDDKCAMRLIEGARILLDDNGGEKDEEQMVGD